MRRVGHRNRATKGAFTLLELLIVVVVVVILALMIVPMHHDPCHAPARVRCLNNLKLVSLGYIMWQNDHGDALPWRVATTNGGTLEYIEQGQALLHFESITNFMEPHVFTCPGDKERRERFDKAGRLTAGTLSYFVNLDTTTNWSNSILAGDRQFKLDGQSVQPGLVTVITNSALSWLPEIHNKSASGGNLAFMDGHVESARDNLNELFRAQGLATSRLVIP